jgi:hypothetical protein
MYKYTFLLRMTDIMTSQNIDFPPRTPGIHHIMGYCLTYCLQILKYQDENHVITVASGVSTITNHLHIGMTETK